MIYSCFKEFLTVKIMFKSPFDIYETQHPFLYLCFKLFNFFYYYVKICIVAAIKNKNN